VVDVTLVVVVEVVDEVVELLVVVLVVVEVVLALVVVVVLVVAVVVVVDDVVVVVEVVVLVVDGVQPVSRKSMPSTWSVDELPVMMWARNVPPAGRMMLEPRGRPALREMR
jgi:hypothetical protein